MSTISLMALGGSTDVVAAPARPNLVVEQLEPSHAAFTPGARVGVHLSVKNAGLSAAGPSRLALYLTRSKGMPTAAAQRLAEVDVPRIKKGKGVTLDLSFDVPKAAAAQQGFLVAAVDSKKQVRESVEVDNHREVPVRVSPDFRPDIVVSNVRLTPARSGLDGRVDVQAQIENSSKYGAFGPVRVGFYCSRDDHISANDHRLSFFDQPFLAAGQVMHVQRALRVDTACPVNSGVTWVGVVVDQTARVAESRENNNSAGARLRITNTPDLTPIELRVNRSDAAPGQRLDLDFFVQNQGSVTAPPSRAGIYLSNDRTIDAGDVLMGTINVPALGAGSRSGTFSHTALVPERRSGKYFVGVLLDDDGRVGELRERNNGRSTALQLRHVDLAEKFFVAKKKGAPAGGELDLGWSVRNTSNEDAPSFSVQFYYSHDARIDPKQDQLLATVRLRGLEAKQKSKERKVSLELPTDARPGNRYLEMVIDAADDLAELDETNNVALRAIEVSPPLPPQVARR